MIVRSVLLGRTTTYSITFGELGRHKRWWLRLVWIRSRISELVDRKSLSVSLSVCLSRLLACLSGFCLSVCLSLSLAVATPTNIPPH